MVSVYVCDCRQKRRSARVTKRQKYLEDVDLSDEDHLLLPSASETQDSSLMVKSLSVWHLCDDSVYSCCQQHSFCTVMAISIFTRVGLRSA